MQTTHKMPPAHSSNALLLFFKVLAIPFVCVIAIQLFDFPDFKISLVLIFAIYVYALVKNSKLWLVILPAVLPVLDLTPWTGRVLVTEFDLLILCSVCVALLLGRLDFSFLKNIGAVKWLLALLILAYTLSTLMGFFALEQVASPEFYPYLLEYNSLRVAKGFFTALVFLPMLAYERKQGTPIARTLSLGITLGLAFAILSVLWERYAFPGLLDMSNTYQVSGMFSGMRLAGAATVGSYFILAFPFCITLFYSSNKTGIQLLAGGVFVGGLYAIYATFNFANYLAVTLSVVIVIIASQYHRLSTDKQPLVSYAIFASIALLIIVSLFKGGYRAEQWSTASQLKQHSLSSFLLGEGKGSYPASYIYNHLSGLDMARFWVTEEDRSFLRFSPAKGRDTLNLVQRFSANQDGQYKVSMTLRNHATQQQKLLVEFCNKNVFSMQGECLVRSFRTSKKAFNTWHTVSALIPSARFNRRLLSSIIPVDINLLNRGLQAKLDIAKVEVFAPDGERLLSNTDFSKGLDNWTFVSGHEDAWTAKSIWVSAFFEGGVIGLILLFILFAYLLLSLFKQLRTGNYFALALFAAISGMTIVGLFSSFFDDPRISWFFYMLVWLSLLKPEPAAVLAKQKISIRSAQILVPLIILSIAALGIASYLFYKTYSYKFSGIRSTLAVQAERVLAEPIAPPYQVRLDKAALSKWQGQGASPIYSAIVTRYDHSRQPLVLTKNMRSNYFSRLIKVSTSQQLLEAIKQATPGDGIELQAGIYEFSKDIFINQNVSATTLRPIVVYAKKLGDVLIAFDTREGFRLAAANWTFQNLIIRGFCEVSTACGHAFHITGNADGTILRNNMLYDFNTAVKANGTQQKNGSMFYPDNVLIEKNTFTNTSARATNSSVTPIEVTGGNNWRIKANFISDFIKIGGNKTAYAAVLKGYGKKGIFEENLIMCNKSLYQKGSVQVGLSLGGSGGSRAKFCFDKQCQYEHEQGLIKNNIIMNCNDVGIYINKAKDTLISNNTLYNTAGIDVRFAESNAVVQNNLLDNRVLARNDAQLTKKNNQIAKKEAFQQAFKAPEKADFTVKNIQGMQTLRTSFGMQDYCHQAIEAKQRIVGATIKNIDEPCHKLLNNSLPQIVKKFDVRQFQITKKLEWERKFQARESKLKARVTVCAEDCEYYRLQEALKAVKTNGTIYLKPGVYADCGIIRRSVNIIGKGAHLKGRVCGGKGALVIGAPNVTIDGLEISNITVGSKNGACIRIEANAKNVKIKDVYCHDSENGILAKMNKAKLGIVSSTFERCGAGGRSHGSYIDIREGEVIFKNVNFLSSKGQGHSLKVSAPHILIEDSTFAALKGYNSRGIDAFGGGQLIIRNSILEQGPNSDNTDMLGYALEKNRLRAGAHSVLLENNWIIFDNPKGLNGNGNGVLFRANKLGKIILKGNKFVGMNKVNVKADMLQGNQHYKLRSEAGLAPFNGQKNSLPKLTYINEREYQIAKQQDRERELNEIKHQLAHKLARKRQAQVVAAQRLEREKNLKRSTTICRYGCEYKSLAKGLKAVKTDGTIYLSPEIYEDCGIIRRSIHIIGKGAHLMNKACGGKGALVVEASDVIIEGLEISNIKVGSQNGACIRIGKNVRNVKIKDVYCHDSQNGILASMRKASLVVIDSTFERCGAGGRSHGSYIDIGNGSAHFKNVKFLSSKGQGHSLKVSAKYILIEDSIFAALKGDNSRGIDAFGGGQLIVRNSLLEQGPNSDNTDMIGYALEKNRLRLSEHSVLLENNWIIFDNQSGLSGNGKGVLFRANKLGPIIVKGNKFVGMSSVNAEVDVMQGNQSYKTRAEAGLAAFNGRESSLPRLMR
ncbi:MAG: hypothetical protein GQ582_03960 [Methyloprofundus sp.]|nr:hypothetical protein [Methyloprofundus sp.]